MRDEPKRKKYRLKELMYIHGYSLKFIAEYLQMSHTSISSFCNVDVESTRALSGDAILKLANLFDCTMESIHTYDKIQLEKDRSTAMAV